MTGTYLRNNIAFRRLTASQFAEFYTAKSFLLGEIIDCNKHEFTSTARELLLQYFSTLLTWLERVERDFIQHGDPDEKQTDRCVDMFISAISRIHEIMDENPKDFNPKFAAIWHDLINQSRDMLVQVLRDNIVPDMSLSFVNLVDFAIGLLNHILFNLHEVDSLLKHSDSAFVYVDRVDVFVLATKGASLVNLRLNLYRDTGLLSSGSDLHVKKHIDDRFLSQDSKRLISYQHIIDQLGMDMKIVGIL